MANEMRDRLVELLYEARYGWEVYFNNSLLKGKPRSKSLSDFIADHLIENGVIVQRKIKGYKDYFIDEYGNIYSRKSHKYLKQSKGKDGYYYVQLCENGKRKRVSVHRLVAQTFIDNPCDLPVVNHKDENRENNSVDNLEWCTEKYNTNYGNARIKQAKAVSKAVVCIETGEVFLSQKQAGEVKKIPYKHICDCCKGKKQTCGGYHWRYATKDQAEQKLKEMRGGE